MLRRNRNTHSSNVLLFLYFSLSSQKGKGYPSMNVWPHSMWPDTQQTQGCFPTAHSKTKTGLINASKGNLGFWFQWILHQLVQLKWQEEKRLQHHSLNDDSITVHSVFTPSFTTRKKNLDIFFAWWSDWLYWPWSKVNQSLLVTPGAPFPPFSSNRK